MKILILNGPNLNLLNLRDGSLYGTKTLDQIEAMLRSGHADHDLTFRQSNHEGELVDWIQQAEAEGFEGLLMNPGGYSHTSVAIHDALELCRLPKVEVHLSNIHAREPFRHASITARRMDGVIAGMGPLGYSLGIDSLVRLSQARGQSEG
jgi:3-dehydroquinate dehydratase-2